jgi:hypothetical protein
MFEIGLIIAFCLSMVSAALYEKWLYENTKKEFDETGWRPKNKKAVSSRHRWWHIRTVQTRNNNITYAVWCRCGHFLYITTPQTRCYRCDSELKQSSADAALCEPCMQLRASIGDDR